MTRIHSILCLALWIAVAAGCGETESAGSASQSVIRYDDDGDGYDDSVDCDDTNAAVNPGATEVTGNRFDEDCSGYANDQDGDGFDAVEAGGFDADDNDPTVYPNAVELCGDEKDNDQDGLVDTDCDPTGDADGDGFSYADGDCDDGNDTVYPGAKDVPDDGIDQDCSGADATNMTLTKLQTEIFTPKCATSGCHAGGRPKEGLSLEAGKTHGETVGVSSVQSPLSLIEAGAPDDSYLVHKLLGTQANVGGSGSVMPKGAPLSDKEIQGLKNWIAAGAAP